MLLIVGDRWVAPGCPRTTRRPVSGAVRHVLTLGCRTAQLPLSGSATSVVPCATDVSYEYDKHGGVAIPRARCIVCTQLAVRLAGCSLGHCVAHWGDAAGTRLRSKLVLIVVTLCAQLYVTRVLRKADRRRSHHRSPHPTGVRSPPRPRLAPAPHECPKSPQGSVDHARGVA